MSFVLALAIDGWSTTRSGVKLQRCYDAAL